MNSCCVSVFWVHRFSSRVISASVILFSGLPLPAPASASRDLLLRLERRDLSGLAAQGHEAFLGVLELPSEAAGCETFDMPDLG